jgi:hypothetical protein
MGAYFFDFLASIMRYFLYVPAVSRAYRAMGIKRQPGELVKERF